MQELRRNPSRISDVNEYMAREKQKPNGGRTVTGICVQELLDDIEFVVPSCRSPFDGRRRVLFARTEGYVLEAPSPVIPDPVDLWVCPQGCHSHAKILCEKLVDRVGGARSK